MDVDSWTRGMEDSPSPRFNDKSKSEINRPMQKRERTGKEYGC